MDTTGTVFLPPGGSTISGDVDALFYFIFWVSVILFTVVVGLMVVFAIRYRRRGKAGLTSGVSHNTPLEITWTVIPIILVMIVFFWGFKTYLKMRVAPKDSIEIKVTGQKWFWTFDYPEGANTTNDLVVPVNKPIKLLMSSTDVIHSFYVPGFRIKMDVLPNRYTVTWFEADRMGTFDLFCTEYCGTGHSQMIGKVRVVSEREYATFLEESGGPGEGEPLDEYGAKLYKARACNTCHTIDGSRLVGPSFKGIYGEQTVISDGSRVTVDENYIRESILKPQAKVVAGYDPVMPTYQGILKPRDVDALIAFIKSLQEQKE